MHPYVHCSSVHGGQDTRQSNCPSIEDWLDEEDVVPVYCGILCNCKKRWNTAICDNTGGPWEYYATWNKSVRKSKEPHDFTYIWDIKLKPRGTDRKQYRSYQRGRGSICGDGRGFDLGGGTHVIAGPVSQYVHLNPMWSYWPMSPQ